ncbi:MAG: hypothetical protein WDZ70_01025 [Candidatus Paceibacterota bacterium]
MKKIFSATLIAGALVPKTVFAHCPLCTAGAGALAVFAASIGVSSVVVGILIGAFALALGLWIGGVVRREYIPYQKDILTGVIFLGTVLPIMPLVRDFSPLYISLGGLYGTALHNTYTINLFILGVIIGAAIMLLSPYLSRVLTRLRGSQIPYQGLSLTLILLVVSSIVTHLLS